MFPSGSITTLTISSEMDSNHEWKIEQTISTPLTYDVDASLSTPTETSPSSTNISSSNELHHNTPGQSTTFLKFFSSYTALVSNPTSIACSIRIYGAQNQRMIAVAIHDPATNLLQCGTFTDSDDYSSLQSLFRSIGASLSFIEKDKHTLPSPEVYIRVDTPSLTALPSSIDEDPLDTIEQIFIHHGISLDFLEESLCRPTPEAYAKIKTILSSRGSREFSMLSSELKIAVGTLSSLLSSSPLLTSYVDSCVKKCFFREYKLLNILQLDESAFVALNIFPNAQDTEKSMSLAGLLGVTKTTAGNRKLQQWLRNPLRSLRKLEERHNIVEIFATNPHLCDSLRSVLSLCPTIDKFTKKITKTIKSNTSSNSLNITGSKSTDPTSSSNAGILELYGLYQYTTRLPSIIDVLKQAFETAQDIDKERLDGNSTTTTTTTNPNSFADSIFQRYLQPLQSAQEDLSPFEQMVESVVDFDSIARREYMVKASFDEELTQLEKERSKIMREMESLRLRVDDDLGLGGSSVKLNHAGNLGYHFRVSRKDERALRSKKNYIPLETRKDGVRFTLPEMKSLSRGYSQAMSSYRSTQAIIESKSIEVAATFLPLFTSIGDIASSLDVLLAFAHISSHAEPQYIRPTILPSSSGILSMRQARHPCLEVQAGVSFIANDIELSQHVGETIDMENGSVMSASSTTPSPSQSPTSSTTTLQPPARVQLVTGPNMGGKSTYIRTAGVCALLAQIGCFVPCESATISLLSSILARVGAGDAAAKGMSTFMKEMIEASAIVRAAIPSSLVIIDELGRGTSTYDGFGLAWAIAEHLASPEVSAYGLYATHFHELTALASIMKSVQNRHVTAYTGEGIITMLYQVCDGPSDRSFGIHVAELARFPEEVVEKAREKARELEAFGRETTNLLDYQQTLQDTSDVGSMSMNMSDDIQKSTQTQSMVMKRKLLETLQEEKENSDDVQSKKQKTIHGDGDDGDKDVSNFLNAFAKIDFQTLQKDIENNTVNIENEQQIVQFIIDAST